MRSTTATDGSRRLLACLALVVLAGCGSLPQTVTRTPSRAHTDTAGTRLGQALSPLAASHAGKTGVHALRSGRDAFAARVLLARAADRSLDVHISRIRAAIEDDPRHPRRIITVRGAGYVFAKHQDA